MSLLITLLADGLSYAAWLFLVSVGLTLVFGVLKILNVAHGAVYALGAYGAAFGVGICVERGWPVAAQFGAIAVAAVLVGLTVGILLDRCVIAPLHKQNEMLILLATYGALLVLCDFAKMVWGGGSLYANAPRDALGTIDIGELVYPVYDIALVAVAGVIGFALWAVLTRTRTGRLVSAVAVDREISIAMGVNAQRILTATFVVGSILGALAGALTAPKIAVMPSIGPSVIVLAFAVVVVGGLGNIGGAALASGLIGLCKAISIHLLPAADLFVIYAVMGIVLAFKPYGLFAAPQARRV